MTIHHPFRTSSGSVIRLFAGAANDNAAAALICNDNQSRGAVNGHDDAPGDCVYSSQRPSMRAGGLSDRILAADGHDDTCRSNIRRGIFVPCRCALREPDDPARGVAIAIAFGQLGCPRGAALPKGLQDRLFRLVEAGDGAALAVRDWLARNGYLRSNEVAVSVPEPDSSGRSEARRTVPDTFHAARPRLPVPSRMDRSRRTAPRILPVRNRGDA